MEFIIKETARSLLVLFSIIAAGYLVGSITVKGISLGTAAIFLTGLLFGHFGAEIPAVLQTVGLLFFTTSVGLSAGPTFIQRLRVNGRAYLCLCLAVAFTGAVTCAAIIKLAGINAPLAVGIMTGAFTTSPGFAAAKEAVSASAEAASNVAAGYGVTYPIGVITKVLFVQLVPRMLRADMRKERALIACPDDESCRAQKTYKQIDVWGVFPFSLAVVLGMLLGGITVPLPGNGDFSLGITGGTLIAGLLVGHIGHLGAIDLRPPPKLYGPIKEIGLILFFSGAGVEGGKGLMDILTECGLALWGYGFLLVALPLVVGFFVFRKLLNIPLLNGLGSITAAMTSTPSLAVLIQVADTDDVATAYATTYPIALITLILLVQVLVGL